MIGRSLLGRWWNGKIIPFSTRTVQQPYAHGIKKVQGAFYGSWNCTSLYYRHTNAIGSTVGEMCLQNAHLTTNAEYETTTTFNYERIRNEIFHYWLKAEAAAANGSNITGCFTLHDGKQEYLKPSAKWHWLDKELSSNLAGETGAVYIYKGALSAMSIRTTSEDALQFCKSHMANETFHLCMFQNIVPPGKHTRLLPVWKLAGWTLGFIPTMIGGSRALYVTVEAVETFVEEHFQEQIVHLKKNNNACPNLVKLLEHCCEDEIHHKEDAAKHLLGLQHNHSDSEHYDKVLGAWWIKPWSMTVKRGSALAAEIARRI